MIRQLDSRCTVSGKGGWTTVSCLGQKSKRSPRQTQARRKDLPCPCRQSLYTDAMVAVDKWRTVMKIVVIGGSGLIGSKLVNTLRERGHDALAASPSTGVNSITREGLAEAMDGADVVVDVANAPSWEDQAVLDFFETSSRNLLAAEAAAGVRHHVALSIVGSERLPDTGYFRAKVAQEALIKASSIPYSIVRATQFSEFAAGIVQSFTVGDEIHASPALIQPIASDDVVAALADVVLAAPLNGTVEVGGPETMPIDELARRYLRATQDSRKVVPDVHARYFGAVLDDQSLVTGKNARLGAIRFDDWLARSTAQ
jgi:uncharacterized protein YbjT (DUF2867 family)